jgi:tRNA threonylcarbamoyl adenosine modification protein YeaZ
MIIAIESASSDPSLALASPDGAVFAADSWAGEGRQASELLPHLLVLLSRAGRELRDATGVGIGVGPGSFTGLRVSMSLAKGMALALGVPLCGVPSLAAWLVAEPGAAAAVTRAGAQEAFVLVRGQPEPRIVPGAELPALLAGLAVVTSSELASAFGLNDVRRPAGAAAAVASLAAARLAENPRGDEIERLEPSYLRLPRGIAPAPAEASQWP